MWPRPPHGAREKNQPGICANFRETALPCGAFDGPGRSLLIPGESLAIPLQRRPSLFGDLGVG